MMNNQPQQLDPESLSQLPKEELVKIIIQQAIVNEGVALINPGTETRDRKASCHS